MRNTRYEQRDTKPYDAIIIGAGPAGLTAAIYTSRARLNTLIIEEPSIMSQAAYADIIENFPGFPDGVKGLELMTKFRNQAEAFGAEILEEVVKQIRLLSDKEKNTWQIITDKNSYQALSVIVASGARERRLEVDGEEKFIGKGVSYCATCDGPFFKDKEIAVVGGGNSAVEEAIFLTRFANKVTLVHRRDRLRADKALQEKAAGDKKITVKWSSTVNAILGQERVTGLRLKHVDSSKESILQCEGVFISVGKTPNTDFLKEVVSLNSRGYIKTKEYLSTTAEGVFACGDCRDTHFRQIITACGDGALAAAGSQYYVDGIKGTVYK